MNPDAQPGSPEQRRHSTDPTPGATRNAVHRLLPAGSGNPALDRLSDLAARLLGVPMAQVTLIGDVQTIVAGHGLQPGVIGEETSVEESLCLVAVTSGGPLAIPDTTVDARVSALEPVRSGRVGAYLGVPLHSDSGVIVGALCVLDAAPRLWSESDVALVEQLATSVRAELELAALSREYEADRMHWQLAVEASAMGYFDWYLVTGELSWDDRLIALYGYDSGDRGFDRSIDSVFARLHPDDADRVGQTMTAAIEAVGPIQIVYRIVLPTGATRWLEARGRALAEGPGAAATRLLGISWDVTEREQHEQRADRVLADMPLGYLAMDRRWRITQVNGEAARLAGSTPEQMLGRNFWDEHPAILGTDFETVYRRVARTMVAESLEAHYPEPLNTWFDVRVTADPSGLSLYFVDVTERRRAQEVAAERAEHDRSIASALQHSLLTDLPDIAGLKLAAAYVTAADGDQVGGDWYDVVNQPDGNVLAVVGDVVGHDIDAAATMGQLRTMLRMLAWESTDGPAHIIGRLDEAARALGVKSLATLVTVSIGGADPATGDRTLSWSNAGHPPPVLLLADGSTEVLERTPTNILLGVIPGAVRDDHSAVLPAGAALVLYTDGLVETRDADLDDGITRLRQSLAGHHDLPANQLVDSVLRDLVGAHPVDDTAVLVVRD